jgi:hypothetical protein
MSNKIRRKSLNKSIKDPLPLKYKEVCDEGLISETPTNPLVLELSRKIGEFHDVYCVANKQKSLAALDFSSYGKTKMRKKFNLKLTNEVINYCNNKNVQYLHNTKTGGMYLKSIFFLPENYEHALKLMYVLWYTHPNFDGINNSIAIGLLLDYSIDNIIFFCKRNYKTIITKKNVSKVADNLKKLEINLEMLQKDFKILHKKTIPTL